MEEKFFRNLINNCLKENSMTLFNILIVSLISAENNNSDLEILQNCEFIEKIINILSEYPNNKQLQEIRPNLTDYNKKYYVK